MVHSFIMLKLCFLSVAVVLLSLDVGAEADDSVVYPCMTGSLCRNNPRAPHALIGDEVYCCKAGDEVNFKKPLGRARRAAKGGEKKDDKKKDDKKKDDKKPAPKKDDKKPAPKKDDKKPAPKKDDKKPAPKKDDKKPNPDKAAKKPDPKKPDANTPAAKKPDAKKAPKGNKQPPVPNAAKIDPNNPALKGMCHCAPRKRNIVKNDKVAPHFQAIFGELDLMSKKIEESMIKAQQAMGVIAGLAKVWEKP